MHRPNSFLKRLIDWDKTNGLLSKLFKNPERIRPGALPEHLVGVATASYSFKLPQLRGNVQHTMWQIMSIFLKEWRTAKQPISIGIRTTCTSLAKRCGNKDPKTAYRHILTLIEHGFLRAKVHVRSGIQLLINPDLVVFDATAPVMAPQPQPATNVAPAAPQGAQTGLASLLALAAQVSQTPPPAFFKNSTRA
ncbi:hypothetical protein [Hymenobacter pini]|uniref:hypothetical protein n=1 Tax=Hymenobacter pini TaxID=2880879 RepID=UPI001CF4A849|nr:hypothetical protein [Hymenobacter pini]MCA8830551.1 hypothetical protein [Hymenobacter pini]